MSDIHSILRRMAEGRSVQDPRLVNVLLDRLRQTQGAGAPAGTQDLVGRPDPNAVVYGSDLVNRGGGQVQYGPPVNRMRDDLLPDDLRAMLAQILTARGGQ